MLAAPTGSKPWQIGSSAITPAGMTDGVDAPRGFLVAIGEASRKLVDEIERAPEAVVHPRYPWGLVALLLKVLPARFLSQIKSQ